MIGRGMSEVLQVKGLESRNVIRVHSAGHTVVRRAKYSQKN